ncbi:MAG: hemolysin family protein [Planctomycetota bacterium]
MSYFSVLIILICLFAIATMFFTVCAIALRTISKGKLIETFKDAGKDKVIDSFIKNSEKLALTCSLYRLVSNIGILLLLLLLFTGIGTATAKLSDYILVCIIAGAIILIFGLTIPSAWAKYSGHKVLSRCHKLLTFFSTIIFPVIYVYQFIDTLTRRLAGVTETSPEEEQEEKQEEFLSGLEVAGIADAEEQEMIENVLELTDTTVDEIMTPRTDIIAIDVNSDRKTVLETITNAGHSRLPVYEENIDKIVGMIYAKDLLMEIDKEQSDFKVRDNMREAYYVPETKHLRELLHEFQNQKLHVAVVLDEYGGTAGIITIEDILEELVGEITDEYEKTPIKPISKIDNETYEVDARTRIDDVNDELALELPEEEDYDTIGGFVFSYLGYIPKTGERFDYKGIQFNISSAEARRIRRIKIKLPDKK